MTDRHDVTTGLEVVRRAIDDACAKASSVTLIAVSIELGATHVRVGSAVFGSRPQHAAPSV